MLAKIITDSCSDITQEEAKRLGITVIPAYVRFGNNVYRDGVDINSDEFYHKLVSSPIHPSTASPSPGDFAKVYKESIKETSEIISIHVSTKHSAVYNAAMLGKEIAAREGCHIEVIDSQGMTMWQGLVAITAAKAAAAGYNLQQLINKVHETISQLRGLAMLDTLSYAVKGGRLGKAISTVESVLNVKPLVTLHNGQIRLAGVARTRNKGITRLHQLLKSVLHINDLAIVHSTNPEEAQALADYARGLFPDVVPHVARLGPTIGVHAGPGTLVAVLRQTNLPITSHINLKASGI